MTRIAIALGFVGACWAGNGLPRAGGTAAETFAVRVAAPALHQARSGTSSSSQGPLVVLMTASWCPPCRRLEHDWHLTLADLRKQGYGAPRLVLVEPQNSFSGRLTDAAVALRLTHSDLARVARLEQPRFPTVWGISPAGDVTFFRVGYGGSERERTDDTRLLRAAATDNPNARSISREARRR